MSIVVTGGSGLLGRELYNINNDLICLNSEFDVFEFKKLRDLLDQSDVSIIIHCAALKTEDVEKYPSKSIDINVIGTCNLSKYCIEKSIRLVYISTDYVYPGTGDHKEDDNLQPQNKYAWTKLGGESVVKLVNNHLIIRTSFGESKFPYERAYDNLFTSKDYVDIIAPMILSASLSDVTGILNIGTNKKSLYQYANVRNDIMSSSLPISKDFSLNLNKYNKNLKLNNQKDFSLNTDKFKNL